MKLTRIFFIALVVMAHVVMPAHAQTLHAIIFADTNDPNIGQYDQQDFINICIETNAICAATGMSLKEYFYKGESCSRANLSNVLEKLKSESNDVILFYYSGHGTRSMHDVSDYPQMCLGSHYEDEFYPLQKVLSELQNQKARLKIVVGDCCNSIGAGVTTKEETTKGVTILTKNPINAYTNLFMNYQGFIIASGSSKGENSITVKRKDGSPGGGLFTISLLAVLQRTVSNGLNSNWEEILALTKDLVADMSKQTPIYAASINKIESRQTAQSPRNTATTNEAQEKASKIEILTAIGNEAYSIEERIEIRDDALKYVFASPDTKVETVGRNGVTIVSTEKAKDFILRLCTAHNLLSLVEVDSRVNSQGQYTYLKIHEIYKSTER